MTYFNQEQSEADRLVIDYLWAEIRKAQDAAGIAQALVQEIFGIIGVSNRHDALQWLLNKVDHADTGQT